MKNMGLKSQKASFQNNRSVREFYRIFFNLYRIQIHVLYNPIVQGGRRGRDRMLVGFTTT